MVKYTFICTHMPNVHNFRSKITCNEINLFCFPGRNHSRTESSKSIWSSIWFGHRS